MKTTSTLIASILMLLSLVSCEDIIDVDLRSVDPELVIEGVVRQGMNAEVRISRTKDFGDDNTYPPITDAQVTISDDAGHTEKLTADASGKFVAATITGVERRTYHLTVVHDGNRYTATSRMPPAVGIDSLTQWKFPMHDYNEPMLHFADPPGEESQWYRVAFAVNGVWGDYEKMMISTEFIDGNVIHYPLMVDFDNGNDDDDPLTNGDIVTVELQCMDKPTYKYFLTLYDNAWALANPTTNIVGGALGYFGAYAWSRGEVKVEW